MKKTSSFKIVVIKMMLFEIVGISFLLWPQSIWKCNFSVFNIFAIASVHPTLKWEYFWYFEMSWCHWKMFHVKLEHSNALSATPVSAVLIQETSFRGIQGPIQTIPLWLESDSRGFKSWRSYRVFRSWTKFPGLRLR